MFAGKLLIYLVALFAMNSHIDNVTSMALLFLKRLVETSTKKSVTRHAGDTFFLDLVQFYLTIALYYIEVTKPHK